MEKKYNHLQAEQEVQHLWEREKTYSTEHNPGPLYSIDTPPPTVSGSLHIGHIFSYTQTDIIARYKRMSGFSVFYPFGFDDNGLPTERFVEKKQNVAGYKMTRSAFIELCLKETQEVEHEFQKLWQRMGLSVDWNLCYSTIDARTRKISQQSFIELYKKGFVYRKDEPALFCTACRTSVAQAELDDAERASTFNDIAFELADNQNTKLIISTTRPELLPSCVALLYNPADQRYQHLQGKEVVVPLFGHKVPLIADEQVLIDKGTGLVMCCTFGDKTDIEWFKKYNLPYRPAMGHDGKFLESTGPLAGLNVKQAREKILELLKEAGALVGQRAISHMVNIHERCKHDIEYLMLPQWFLKLLPYKQEFIKLGEQINWYPTFMKSRYKNWVENINWDWCLSRQRFFGIPFPAWHCITCQEIIMACPEDLPVDPQETAYKGTCPKCGSSTIVPDTDVMDTWNTSSLTPYICKELYKGDQQFLPMSMRPQAHDIIRTWAFYTIVKTWMHDSTIPWKDIIISGHVLSTQKEKISKSQGNSPLAPENLLSLYPADVLRYWTASATLGHDVAFSDTQLKIGQRLLTKLWNAFLFIKEYGIVEAAATNNSYETGSTVHAWIMHRSAETFKTYQYYFDQQEFSLALDAVEKFFWHDVCDNYLELVKDQLFNPSSYAEQEVARTRRTLATVGLRLLQLYAPFMPHITEAIYQALYQDKIGTCSLHQTRFSDYQQVFTAPDAVNVMNTVLSIVGAVRKLKSDHQLSLKTPLKQLVVSAVSPKMQQLLTKEEQLLKGVTRAESILYAIEAGPVQLEKHDDVYVCTVSLGQ